MATCDLCNGPAGANSKRYSCSQFRRAVLRGLRPPDTVSMLGAAFGMSKEETAAGWIQQVMSDSTDWALCETCAKKAAQYKISTKWWQFWK